MTYREKLIELLQENTQASCELFYFLVESEDSPINKILRGYTSSSQAVQEVINKEIE